jgi:hypothetical protein
MKQDIIGSAMRARAVAIWVLAITVTATHSLASEKVDWDSVATRVVGMDVRAAAVELILSGVGVFEQKTEPVCGKEFVKNSVVNLQPPTKDKKPIIFVRSKGAILPDVTNMSVGEAENELLNAGFLSINNLADTGSVDGVLDQTPGTCLATNQNLYLVPSKSADQRVVSGSRCIPPELPTIFLRDGDDQYSRWSTNGQDIVQAHPKQGHRLMSVIDGDALSPFFIAVMTDERGSSAEFRTICKNNIRLVTSTMADIDGLDRKTAFLIGEAIGIQLDEARILVWEMASNQWHVVVALDSIIDFDLGLGEAGLRVSMVLEGGDIEIADLGAGNLENREIVLDQLATERDRVVDMGSKVYLIGESGWVAVSATDLNVRHLDAKGGSVLDARRFRTGNGLSQGLISLMRRMEGAHQKVVASIVVLDENNNEVVLPEVDLTELFSTEKIRFPAILAIPIDEVQSGINLLLAYNKGDTGRIACIETTGVAENSIASLVWADTLDNGHDPSFYRNILHGNEKKLMYIDEDIDYQTNIRGVLGGCAR